MLSPSVPSPARIFVDVKKPNTFLSDIEGPHGAFIPTRLRPPLGEQLLIAVKLEDAVAPIDLPVTVLARRAPRGSGGFLSMGVQVRLSDQLHPAAVWLRRVVTAKAAEADVMARVFSVFPVAAELERELQRLADGERGLLLVDQQVHVGDRLVVKATAEDAPGSLTFRVVVKGTSLHDGVRSFSAVLLSDEDRREVLRFLSREEALTRRTA